MKGNTTPTRSQQHQQQQQPVCTLSLSFSCSHAASASIADAYTCYNLGQTTGRQNTIDKTTGRVQTAGSRRTQKQVTCRNEGIGAYMSHMLTAVSTDVTANITNDLCQFHALQSKILGCR